MGVVDTNNVIYRHIVTPSDGCNGERINSKDEVKATPSDLIGRTFPVGAQPDGQNGERINSKDEVEATPEFHPSRGRFVGVTDTKKVIYRSEVRSAPGHNKLQQTAVMGRGITPKIKLKQRQSLSPLTRSDEPFLWTRNQVDRMANR